MAEKNYDSTIVRIAGNLLSGDVESWITGGAKRAHGVAAAVQTARAIVEEVQRTGEREP